MSIRKLMTLAGFALAVVALAPTSALAQVGGTDQPLKEKTVKGSFSGTSSWNVLTGAFTEDVTGTSTVFGKFTRHIEGGMVVPFNASGSGSLVAANGDVLNANVSLHGTDITTTGHTDTGITVFVDGTGRFATVRGRLTETDQVSTISLPTVDHPTLDSSVEGTFTGQISY